MEPPKLTFLRAEYSEWTIEYARDADVYIAVSHPAQNSTHILAAHTLEELREKLEEAEHGR